MNLERIIPQNSDYMVLNMISKFKKLYLCMDYKGTTLQKINTGAIIEAFPYKDINQFKGTRPFFMLTEDRIIENVLNDGGIYDKYETKLQIGSVVDYAGLNYLVVGFIVNNYAQWNLPTPILLNPNGIVADYKSLFQGKMTDYQINEKINDKFQNGFYDEDILMPLVDGNSFEEDILVVENRVKENEISLYINKVKKENNLTLKATENVFIDTILNTSGDEIQKLREVNEDLYDKTKNFMNSVNQIINAKINNKEKKQVEDVVDLSFLDDLDDIFNDDFLQEIDDTF